jgi:phosphoribosylamine--glycine ligase
LFFPRTKNDLVELLNATAEHRLEEIEIEKDPRAATTVMLVSGGYPGSYDKGKTISGIELAANSIVFHAGTKVAGNDVLTNGGRVIAVTSYGATVADALEVSKKNASIIDFEGKYFRKDIGFDV